MQVIFYEQQVVSQIVFGGGVWFAFEEFREFADGSAVGFLRTLFETVKLQVLFEANEDWGQRIFVFGHSETPWSDATNRRCFEMNIDKSVAGRRTPLCFRASKDKEVK